MSEKTFDFIDAAGKGYQFVWNEREVLTRLAVPVLLIKLAVLTGLYLFGLQEDFLRAGLVLLPSDFVDAVFVVLLIRFAVFNEPPLWSSFTESKGTPRYRNMMAAVLIYVLLKLLASMFAGLVIGDVMNAPEVSPESSSPIMFVVAMLALAFSIWAFRLFLLYVPVAMEIGIKDFLHRVRGFGFSFVALATWLLCFVPVITAIVLFSEVLSFVLPVGEGEGLTPYKFLLLIAQAGAEIISAALISSAVAFGIQDMNEGER